MVKNNYPKIRKRSTEDERKKRKKKGKSIFDW